MSNEVSMTLEGRLAREITGGVFFDAFNRGRYATDASFYQIMPLGVVVPRTMEEALRALAISRDAGKIVTPRGGGTSQCGQTVNDGIVIDFSKHLNRIISLDLENRSCVVEPGIVLDDLNRQLKKHGLWFPVDVSTASRATIGGMAGNNSCGGRSLRYGTMRDNTRSMDAALADGTMLHFGEVPRDLAQVKASDSGLALFRDMLDLGAREADEIAEKFPKVQRRVGGYNLDALVPRNAANNMAHLLVGSEGTLAFTTQVELKLWPIIRNKVLGVCHFGSFYAAMDAAQHLVKLRPIAVELVDRTMLALGREIEMFKPIIGTAVRGDPDAVLIVEFAEEDQAENIRRLKALNELMADLGFSWDQPQRKWGGVVEITEPSLQTGIAEFRAAGLNVMMSMKQGGKPVSFVEDCAVPLPHLADYTERLNAIFARHGTRDRREQASQLAADQVLEARCGDRVVTGEVGLERVERAGRERQGHLEPQAGRDDTVPAEPAEHLIRRDRIIDARPRGEVHRAGAGLDAEHRGLVGVAGQLGGRLGLRQGHDALVRADQPFPLVADPARARPRLAVRQGEGQLAEEVSAGPERRLGGIGGQAADKQQVTVHAARHRGLPFGETASAASTSSVISMAASSAGRDRNGECEALMRCTRWHRAANPCWTGTGNAVSSVVMM